LKVIAARHNAEAARNYKNHSRCAPHLKNFLVHQGSIANRVTA
jgi:hypothetical protein